MKQQLLPSLFVTAVTFSLYILYILYLYLIYKYKVTSVYINHLATKTSTYYKASYKAPRMSNTQYSALVYKLQVVATRRIALILAACCPLDWRYKSALLMP